VPIAHWGRHVKPAHVTGQSSEKVVGAASVRSAIEPDEYVASASVSTSAPSTAVTQSGEEATSL
jgi:hypothetical protein